MYPVLFNFGPITIYSYGVMAAIGILSASCLIWRHAQRQGLPAERVIDLIFWMVVFGLLGARLLYVILNPEVYIKNPVEIIMFNKGGLSFHGGFFLGIVTAILFIKKNKLPLLKTLDILAVYAPLAHAFGRIGCFFNGCCYGKAFYPGIIFNLFGIKISGHPTQIYSSVLLFMLFFVLLKIENKKKFYGQTVFSYMMLYGLLRFFIEFLRADNPVICLGLTLFQCISIFLFAVGSAGYVYIKKRTAVYLE
ncbi:MAG: prolipoprotein diacylglyceryl transferase [Candidatus Omnitrophica bacterium]|nr:prolipoprotein diacylglyceryl transferase [Candidatus Omnitrophota bacterium]